MTNNGKIVPCVIVTSNGNDTSKLNADEIQGISEDKNTTRN